MKIIGIVGPAGAGKSLIAEYLVLKYGATRYSFAEPLKEIVRRTFDMTHEQVYGTQAQKEKIDPRYGVSPRWILQRLGTEGVREVLGPDFWWSHCLKQIERHKPAIAVIDDMRFTNEAAGVLALNEDAKVLAWNRPRVSHVWRIESDRPRDTTADASHQSEAEWMACAYTDIVKIECQDWSDEVASMMALYDAVDFTADQCGLTPTEAVLR